MTWVSPPPRSPLFAPHTGAASSSSSKRLRHGQRMLDENAVAAGKIWLWASFVRRRPLERDLVAAAVEESREELAWQQQHAAAAFHSGARGNRPFCLPFAVCTLTLLSCCCGLCACAPGGRGPVEGQRPRVAMPLLPGPRLPTSPFVVRRAEDRLLPLRAGQQPFSRHRSNEQPPPRDRARLLQTVPYPALVS